MTAQTLTLTDFLLARIAEDEEALRDARISDGPEWWMPEHWTRERGLAECEAKRRIVEEVLPHLEHVEGAAIDGGMYDENRPHARWDLLRLLALPYADHPDYREEWRV